MSNKSSIYEKRRVAYMRGALTPRGAGVYTKRMPRSLGKIEGRGFVVSCQADMRKDRLFLVGRLEDGRSFAAAQEMARPALHVFRRSLDAARRALSALRFDAQPPALEAFDGREPLVALSFANWRDLGAARRRLEEAGILSPDADLKPADAFLIQNRIKGHIEIEGEARPGRLVDLVFPEPRIHAVSDSRVALRVASIDIETDVESGAILAAAMVIGEQGTARALAAAPDDPGEGIFFHESEAALLGAFLDDIRKADPDVLTGWNFLDFDFPRIAERCAFFGIPFAISRGDEEAKFFPASNDVGTAGFYGRRRSAAALVPGRQVLDALRIFRSGPKGWSAGRREGFTLEAVANSVLGEGKLVSASGAEKIAELKALYQNDPLRFSQYCKRDAALVLEILDKTGLFKLTAERASLTGVSLDKAWTSVVSFERIYGMELRRLGIAPPALDPRRSVSGAAGGTVLEPASGLFHNVAVFDFRSLYPSIIRTFNIDPLSYERTLARTDTKANEKDLIIAPNGATFLRERGILPGLIETYTEARRKALEAGDEEASFVYKILMNSFYGVLGTPASRYGRSELAGAITSFAKKWLYFSRDWFERAGRRVLYGDTDSLFVETGLGDGASYHDFIEWGKSRAAQINAAIKEEALREYGLESFLDLRFEKAYRRFMIPPLRGSDEGRGRAKGYGGHLLADDGGLSVEVKGMEAVRSDYTPLARRVQIELLELVFSGCPEAEFANYVSKIISDLRRGLLDGELVYRKRLARAPETYTASTPPQVKAARALGWKNRRGSVEYVWTTDGPQPSSDEARRPLAHAPLDYDHYASSQVLPAVRSIVVAAGWNAEAFCSQGRDFFLDGQLELELHEGRAAF